MKKGLLFFTILSCMIIGFDNANAASLVSIKAVQNVMQTSAPGGMDKNKFVQYIQGKGAGLTTTDVMTACRMSMSNLPEDCDKCYSFVKQIIAEHNKLTTVVVPVTPGIVNPGVSGVGGGNNPVIPVVPVAPVAGGDNPAVPGAPVAPVAGGDSPAVPGAPVAPVAGGDNPAVPGAPVAPVAGGDNPAVPGAPVAPVAGGDTPVTPITTTPTFQSICERDGGTYSTGKKSYGEIYYDGEYCKSKTACVKLFENSGIQIRGIILDKSQAIYCFSGTADDRFVASKPVVLPDEKAQSCTVGYLNSITYKSGGTYKLDCAARTGSKVLENKLCDCTCNSGKWSCKEVPGQQPKMGAGLELNKNGKSSTYDRDKGTWSVTFDYGTVQGTSKCEAEPGYTDGGNCFCKVTSLPNKQGSFAWVKHRYQPDCKTACAYKCAELVKTDMLMRQDLYGK